MSSEDWPEVRLGDLVDERGISYGIVQPGSACEDGVPVIRVNNLQDGRIVTDDVKRVAPDVESKYGRTRLRGGEVLVSLVGSLGETAIVPPALRGWNVARAVAVVPVRDDIGADWVAYALQSPGLQHRMRTRATTTVQATLNLQDVRELPIPLPDRSQRDRATALLRALDDKIELNHRMNHTLESIARAIFKSWFVDFDPVRKKMEGGEVGLPPDLVALFPSTMQTSSLGSIPEGWRVVPIGEAIGVVGGSTPSRFQPEFWDGDISFATPKDLAGLHGPFLRQTARRITERGARSISSGVLSPGTVLLSSRAPVGYVAISMIPVTVNQGFIAMPAGGELPSSYVYFWLRANMDAIIARGNGTTFLEVSKRSFRPLPVLVPPASVLKAYDILVQPVLQRLALALEEAEQLAELRDQLLPRLVGGDGHG